jgi:5'-3' exonuclease
VLHFLKERLGSALLRFEGLLDAEIPLGFSNGMSIAKFIIRGILGVYVEYLEDLEHKKEKIAAEREEMLAERAEMATERERMLAERAEMAVEREVMVAERDALMDDLQRIRTENAQLAAEIENLACENEKMAARRKALNAGLVISPSCMEDLQRPVEEGVGHLKLTENPAARAVDSRKHSPPPPPPWPSVASYGHVKYFEPPTDSDSEPTLGEAEPEDASAPAQPKKEKKGKSKKEKTRVEQNIREAVGIVKPATVTKDRYEDWSECLV